MKTTEFLLREVMERARRVSQKELAKELHISETYLSDILNRRRELSKKVGYSLGYKPKLMWEKL